MWLGRNFATIKYTSIRINIWQQYRSSAQYAVWSILCRASTTLLRYGAFLSFISISSKGPT